MLDLESTREGDRPGGEGEGRQEKEKGAHHVHPGFPLQLPPSFFFSTILVLIFLAGFLSLSQTVRQKQPKHRSFEV